MCSYIVEKAKLVGSAKGAQGWMRIDTANVYYDHPFHSPLDHVLGLNFTNEMEGGRERVALELSADFGPPARGKNPRCARERRSGAWRDFSRPFAGGGGITFIRGQHHGRDDKKPVRCRSAHTTYRR